MVGHHKANTSLNHKMILFCYCTLCCPLFSVSFSPLVSLLWVENGDPFCRSCCCFYYNLGLIFTKDLCASRFLVEHCSYGCCNLPAFDCFHYDYDYGNGDVSGSTISAPTWPETILLCSCITVLGIRPQKITNRLQRSLRWQSSVLFFGSEEMNMRTQQFPAKCWPQHSQ